VVLIPERLIFPLPEVSEPPNIYTPAERLLVPLRLISPPPELIVPNEIEIPMLLLPEKKPPLPVFFPVRLIFPPSELSELPRATALLPPLVPTLLAPEMVISPPPVEMGLVMETLPSPFQSLSPIKSKFSKSPPAWLSNICPLIKILPAALKVRVLLPRPLKSRSVARVIFPS
jgi:hypothetical protein